MGDQAGVAVSGTLYYVPYKEFERVRALPLDALEKTAIYAALCRINTLYMIARAGSGHIGSSFSSMDIMCWLLLNEIRPSDANDPQSPNDIFFSSKGHDAPGLYSAWIGLGKLDFDLLHQLRRLDGLPGHPDISTPNVVTNTGSLGMGVSKAKGMIFANRLHHRSGNVFVLTGDGELQEGQFWESLISAANHKLGELTVIVDHNKLQSDTLISKVSDLGNLEAKFAAFGWHVSRCDGNNFAALSHTLAVTKDVTDKPKVIIADTVKGKGVSFMEHTSIDSDVELYKFHSGAPAEDAYVRASEELTYSANALLAATNAEALELESVIRPTAVQATNPQRLIQAYSNALIEQAGQNLNIVALDADLILDTGLIPYQQAFPERFLECGIAEQDMVSQAGGMALKGVLPIVHSFACFLSSRPNENIYNNATEGTKIIYVGSLAGVVPAGPGHSHQAVRDISSLGGIPNLTLVEPSCEDEVGQLLDWAINANDKSTYIRLVSIPSLISYQMPTGYQVVKGVGAVISEGDDALIITSGPVLLEQAYKAVQALTASGINVGLVNLPWLNHVDTDWLNGLLRGYKHVFIYENHYEIGGQGDRICSAIDPAVSGATTVHRLAISTLPECGTNPEILAAYKFQAADIADNIKSTLA